MRLSSFCRSGLGSLVGLPFCDRPSLRRVLRAFLAARRRWPAGRLSVGLRSLRWMTGGPDDFCGLLLSGWPMWREGVVIDALFRARLGRLAWLLFPSVRRGWEY